MGAVQLERVLAATLMVRFDAVNAWRSCGNVIDRFESDPKANSAANWRNGDVGADDAAASARK